MSSPHGTFRPHDVVESPTATERPTKRARLEEAEDNGISLSGTLRIKPDARSTMKAAREEQSAGSGDARQNAPKREGTLQVAEGAKEVRKPRWRHIGRIPGAPDSELTESDPSLRRPLQLPTEVCERIIDWMWGDPGMLKRCTLVCKAWTPRCRYWMQRNVLLWDRSEVQGYARRARAQPHLLQQARSVSVVSGAKLGERVPIPHLDTFAMMGAAKLPLVWRLVIVAAIWKPRDFHPLIFVHLSAFTSITTLWLHNVTFPKVHEFGRLVCALPSLVRLRCRDVLFTSTVPCASLAITRCPPSVRLTDLTISSFERTSSSAEAIAVLIGHLCAAGVIADLQKFTFSVWASPDNEYLDVCRESLHELFKQCSRSLCSLKLRPFLYSSKAVQEDVVSGTIASVFDITYCDNLETVALEAGNFEVGYSWMLRVLESNVSKKLREVSIIVNYSRYNENANENLQMTVSALGKDLCPQLNELFSSKEYEKLYHVDFVFRAAPGRSIADASRWSTLLKAEMPKLDERGVLRTRVDVYLNLFHEDYC